MRETRDRLRQLARRQQPPVVAPRYRLGFNTNGCPFHRWPEALDVMAEIGYQAVGITLDHHCLDPYADRFPTELTQMRTALDRLAFQSVIETGARFLLNPRVKHEPTLVSPTMDERDLRIDFLRRAIDICAELGSTAVSLWSGVVHDGAPREVAFERLVVSLDDVLRHAERRGVMLAFEPEPGMLIDTLASYSELAAKLGHPPALALTIDIGHVHCLGEGDIPTLLRLWSPHLKNIHIEDMCRGVHDHLRFGEGEINFPPILQALAEMGYPHGLYVELSRHGHMAPEVMRESFEFLKRQGPQPPA